MASVNLESEPFRITRLELARTGALQYIKTFWFILAGVPLAGILLLIFMPSKFGIAFGLLFLAWPLTIPGRVALVSWQKGNLLLKPTLVRLLGRRVGVCQVHLYAGNCRLLLPLGRVGPSRLGKVALRGAIGRVDRVSNGGNGGDLHGESYSCGKGKSRRMPALSGLSERRPARRTPAP